MKPRLPIRQRLAIVCSVYLVWLAYTMTTKPGLKDRIVVSIKKRLNLLPEGILKNAYAQAKPDSTGMDAFEYRRIPCGLIAIDTTSVNNVHGNKEEDVLPLQTVAFLPNKNGKLTREISTLHERTLKRFPQLQKYVQISDDGIIGIIPMGTFRLRMGSVEGTIEQSPELRIVSDDNIDGGIDFVLGTNFWMEHSARFGEDELYVSTTPVGDSTDAATEINRVMVPYLSMRSTRNNFEL